VTSVDRTAYPRFGRVVSGRELAESFTPTDAEIEWARTRTQDEQRLLALVVWLKSYQRLGYFPKVDDVPPAVVRHVRDALGLAGNVEPEQAAERTAKRYRELVRARMKVTYDTARVRQIAEQAIRKAVQAKDNPADLINVALEELVRARRAARVHDAGRDGHRDPHRGERRLLPGGRLPDRHGRPCPAGPAPAGEPGDPAQRV